MLSFCSQEALYRNREMAIRCIVGSWPTQVLLLRHMVPQLFTSVQTLYNMAYQSDIVKQGLRYTTSLAHTFLDALKNNSNTKLRFLDLTGFPSGRLLKISYFRIMFGYNGHRKSCLTFFVNIGHEAQLYWLCSCNILWLKNVLERFYFSRKNK